MDYGRWFEDQDIDEWTKRYHKPINKLLVLPTYVFNGIKYNNAEYNTKDNVHQRLKGCGVDKLMVEDEWLLMIPVLINGNHWVLYVFVSEKPDPLMAMYFDSAWNGHICSDFDIIANYCHDTSVEMCKVFPSSGNLYQQDNGNDCGPVILLWIDRLITIWWTCSSDKRFLEIMNVFNNCREPITKMEITKLREKVDGLRH